MYGTSSGKSSRLVLSIFLCSILGWTLIRSEIWSSGSLARLSAAKSARWSFSRRSTRKSLSLMFLIANSAHLLLGSVLTISFNLCSILSVIAFVCSLAKSKFSSSITRSSTEASSNLFIQVAVLRPLVLRKAFSIDGQSRKIRVLSTRGKILACLVILCLDNLRFSSREKIPRPLLNPQNGRGNRPLESLLYGLP